MQVIAIEMPIRIRPNKNCAISTSKPLDNLVYDRYNAEYSDNSSPVVYQALRKASRLRVFHDALEAFIHPIKRFSHPSQKVPVRFIHI